MKKRLLSAIIAGTVIMVSGCSNPAPASTSDTEQSQVQEDTSADEENEGQEDVSDEESKEQVTFEDLVAANTRESALSRHDSYAVDLYVIDDGHGQADAYGSNSYKSYVDKDNIYGIFDHTGVDGATEDIWDFYITPVRRYWRSHTEGKDDIWGLDWYFMNDDEKGDPQSGYDVVGDGTDGGEVLISSEDNGDGTLTLTTNAPATEGYDIIKLPDEWKDATLEYKYIVDKDTLELRSLTGSVITEDETIDYLEETAAYDDDAEVPGGMEALKDFAEKAENSEPENPRTITVIYDPGTDKEETFTCPADQSYRVTTYMRDGYDSYEDPEGKTPKQPSDGKSDVTIYAIKGTDEYTKN